MHFESQLGIPFHAFVLTKHIKFIQNKAVFFEWVAKSRYGFSNLGYRLAKSGMDVLRYGFDCVRVNYTPRFIICQLYICIC